MIDVSPYHLEIIQKILCKHIPKYEVRAFGSRVTWTAKDYSDLDLAVVGKKKLADKILYALKEDFEESDLPFRVDVLDFNNISDEFRGVINKGYEVLQKSKTKFKETEIGMIPEGWEVCPFSNAVSVNPYRKLKKGVITKKVSMQNLQEFRRKIAGYEIAKFNGGTKFKNNDTLMARITPCLENGKTSYVDILDKGEIGFGSTEFNVLCGKDGKTIDKFVYYLATSSSVRAEAINSMVGTSGRQRIQSDVFDNILILIPSIIEQETIVKILSDLDDKIELNQQMNKTLEAIGQALFKRWFVDYEFPMEIHSQPSPPALLPEGEGSKTLGYKSLGGEMVESELGKIPNGWKAGKLGEIIENLDSKRIPLSSRERKKRQGRYPYYGAESIMDYVDDYIFDGKYILMGEDGTVIDGKGYPVLQYVWGKFWVNNHAHILRGKEGVPLEFVFLFLKNTNIVHIVTGAVQPKINQGNMNNVEIVIPSKRILSQFNNIIFPIFASYRRSIEEIKNLSQICDSLLPRLMSGKTRVDIKNE